MISVPASSGFRMMIAALVLALASAATAGPTPEQKCEAGKNDAAGKYDACAAKAEKGRVSTGNMTKYADALANCEGKLVDTWTKLEADAVSAAAVCPSTGNQEAIRDFVDACVQSVAVAVGGGTLGPDPVTCASDLRTCDGDLATCDDSLATCAGSLGACNGSLDTCNASVATCNGSLDTCNGSLATCDGSLATATAGTAAIGDVLSGATFTSTAGLGATGTMPDNGAVTLTPATSDQAIAAGYHSGAGKCSGDADLAAANILTGVSLFGVSGTVIQASGAATAGDVLSGATFSNSGGAGTGTMPNNGAVSL
ncbi:MAG TPA: hypothetical protein VEL28_03915, partial [Candidatus Binatia bacterium]|nr:hypothetical protein [Candidatus Binatia bacterium]